MEKFQKLAKIKQFDIGSFNQGILDLSRNHHQSVNSGKYCAQCNKVFSGTSRPTPCPSCQQLLHKSCSRPHMTQCSDSIDQDPITLQHHPQKRQRVSSPGAQSASPPPHLPPATGISPSCSSSTPRSSSGTGYISTLGVNLISSGINTFTGRNTLVSFVPAVSSFQKQVTLNTSLPSSMYSSVNAGISSYSSACTTTITTSSASPRSLTTPLPSLPDSQEGSVLADYPPGPGFHLVNSQQPASNTRNGGGRTTAKNKVKDKPGLSPEAAQIEYLTTELNYTHSKIISQDNTIKDLEQKVKILTESLKMSEEKLNSDLHRKYFGTANTHTDLKSHNWHPFTLGGTCCFPTPPCPPTSCCQRTPSHPSTPHHCQ